MKKNKIKKLNNYVYPAESAGFSPLARHCGEQWVEEFKRIKDKINEIIEHTNNQISKPMKVEFYNNRGGKEL
jgi:hypothetical protein